MLKINPNCYTKSRRNLKAIDYSIVLNRIDVE